MTTRRYMQLDVFADRPGAGNPLAVVLDGEGLDDATMQAIARWTRLPETTFVFPATKPEASYGIRICRAGREVPSPAIPASSAQPAGSRLATHATGCWCRKASPVAPLRVTARGPPAPSRAYAAAKVMESLAGRCAPARVLDTLPWAPAPA